jgi:hypothetical protein
LTNDSTGRFPWVQKRLREPRGTKPLVQIEPKS